MRYKTANEVINQVVGEIGISSAQDVTSAPDPVFSQLITLANAVGHKFVQDRAWRKLKARHEFVTIAGQTEYDLPPLFAYMIPQTGWESSQIKPMQGPATDQQWAYLDARNVAGTLRVIFHFERDKMVLQEPLGTNERISFWYVSEGWVEDSKVAGALTDFIDAPGDIVRIPPYLFERALKLQFLDARGMDTVMAGSDYREALEAWRGHDASSQILNAGEPQKGVRLLDVNNLPDTGYGQ